MLGLLAQLQFCTCQSFHVMLWSGDGALSETANRPTSRSPWCTMGWLLRLPCVVSVILLANMADTAACKSSCASSTPQQQQGGSSHSAAQGGPDHLLDYDSAATVSKDTLGLGSGIGGSKASVTVPELAQCKLCNHSLYSVKGTSRQSCLSCLTASSNKVGWKTKDLIARTIAVVVLTKYVGELPVYPLPEEFPCVDCLLFMLEVGASSDFEACNSFEELELCGMCLWDGRVTKPVATSITYFLTSFYLQRHIHSGLPYDDDHSKLGKLLRIMSPQTPDWLEVFFEEFLSCEDSDIAPLGSFRSGIPTKIWQRSAAIIKPIIYPPKQRVKPCVAATTSTNKVPPAKGALTAQKAQSHGVQGPSKGKASPAKAKPKADSAQQSSVSTIGGAPDSTLQPACEKCDAHEESSQSELARLLHKYMLMSEYFVHDARDTPIECAWLAYFGLCVVVNLLAVPTLWFRYLRALDKQARKGRRPARNLVGFVSFACVDIITFVRYALAPIKGCLQAVFTARFLGWFGLVFLVRALFVYAYIHSGSVWQHTLVTYMPLMLVVTALFCACISFPRLMTRLLYQPIVACLAMPVTLGRRLGHVMSQPSQEHDTLHSQILDCDRGGGRDSFGGQRTNQKQPPLRNRSKGRKGRSRTNSTLMPNSSSACSNNITSRDASSTGETHTMANTAGSCDTVASNSNACDVSTVVATDTHDDKAGASMPPVSTTGTVTFTAVQDTVTTQAQSHCAGGTQSTAISLRGPQQVFNAPVERLPVAEGSCAHAATVATTSAPAATMTPVSANVAASSPPQLPPADAHVVTAHPAITVEATAAAQQSAVAPPKTLPLSQSVVEPSKSGQLQAKRNDSAGGNRLHSNRVTSSFGRRSRQSATWGREFIAGTSQAPPSSTMKLPSNKVKTGTTSSTSGTASHLAANASGDGWHRMSGHGSSSVREVPATSGPHSVAPYRPLVLPSIPTASSTTGSLPSPDPLLAVTLPDLEEVPSLAADLASSGPPVPGHLTVPLVNAPAVTTAPLILPPPLQLDSLAMATASAVPAEATPIAEPAVDSDASSGVGGEGLCVICWDGELTHGLMHDDCIHLCMCGGCSAKYDHDAHGCPVCRRAGELIQL